MLVADALFGQFSSKFTHPERQRKELLTRHCLVNLQLHGVRRSVGISNRHNENVTTSFFKSPLS